MYGARKISASLQRHGSTKQLINRYEAFDSPSRSGIQESKTPTKGIKSRISPSRKKEKSPIRESFRNLLSVFKKDRTLSEDKWVGTLDQFSKSGPGQERSCNDIDKLHVPIPIDLDVATSSSPPLQSPRMGGNLMYLVQDSHTSYTSPPTSSWVECSAVMAPEGLRLSFLHGSAPEHIVSLVNCADVQSCSIGALSEQEQVQLPIEFTTQGYRIFDVFFHPNGRERFAVASVQQRAKWVSAIWDTIIDNQESKSLFNAYLSEDPTGSTSRLSNAHARDPPPPPVQKGYSNASSDLDRKLPPIPQETPAVHSVSSAPASQCYTPSVYPPTQMLSPRDTQKRASSPSIANLAQRSMVKQRLSQMESRSRESSPSRDSINRGRSNMTPTPFAASPADSVLNMYTRSSSTGSAAPSTGGTPIATESQIKRYTLTDSVPTSSPENTEPSLKAKEPPSHSRQVTQQQNAEQTNYLSEIQRDILNVLPNVASLLENHIPPGQLQNMDQALAHLCGSIEVNQRDVQRVLEHIESGGRNTSEPRQPSTFRNVGRVPSQESLRPGSREDTAVVLSKLDTLIASIDPKNKGTSQNIAPELAEALERLRSDDESKATQAQQQGETIRYLHELNSWLQAFVDNGTSQIHGVLFKLDHLAAELGIQPQGSQDDQCPVPPVRGGVLDDIRQALEDMKQREGHASALYESVNGLHGFLSSQAAAKNEFTPEVVLGLLDKQREEQDGQIRALATELTNEIRGERVRFVDAMKEATAINVQAHVDQFKKELTKEVFLMTKEVGRLHQERQGLEAQIADLFSFYKKQQSSVKGGGGPILPVGPVGPVQVMAQDPQGRILPVTPSPGQYVGRPQVAPIQTEHLPPPSRHRAHRSHYQ